MAEIYQRFDVTAEFRAFAFDSKNIINKAPLERKVQGKFDDWLANLHNGSETLKKSLIEKGYEVLESNDVLMGVHGSIILGSEPNRNCKADFSIVAEQFQLPYRSGPCYFKANPIPTKRPSGGYGTSSDSDNDAE